jgi:hypothetical protein
LVRLEHPLIVVALISWYLLLAVCVFFLTSVLYVLDRWWWFVLICLYFIHTWDLVAIRLWTTIIGSMLANEVLVWQIFSTLLMADIWWVLWYTPFWCCLFLLSLGCGIWWAMRMLFVAAILKGFRQLQDPHLLLHSIGSSTWNYPFNLFYFCHQYMDMVGLYNLCLSHWFWSMVSMHQHGYVFYGWRHITWLCISIGLPLFFFLSRLGIGGHHFYLWKLGFVASWSFLVWSLFNIWPPSIVDYGSSLHLVFLVSARHRRASLLSLEPWSYIWPPSIVDYGSSLHFFLDIIIDFGYPCSSCLVLLSWVIDHSWWLSVVP